MTLQNKRILVIEDDPDIARMLELNLREEGFTVDFAADGKPAWRSWLQGPMDC